MKLRTINRLEIRRCRRLNGEIVFAVVAPDGRVLESFSDVLHAEAWAHMTRSFLKAKTPDAYIVGRMGFYTITPLSTKAKTWMRRHLERGAYRETGVHFDDTRLAQNVMQGMKDAGLVFEGD